MHLLCNIFSALIEYEHNVQDRRHAHYKFELLERKRYRMSWGPATVFIHRRLSDDGSILAPYRLNILPSDAVTYDEDSTARSSNSSVDTNPPPASQATSKAATGSPIVTVTKQTSPQYSASKYDYMDEEEEDDDDDDDEEEEEEDDNDVDDDDQDDDDVRREYSHL